MVCVSGIVSLKVRLHYIVTTLLVYSEGKNGIMRHYGDHFSNLRIKLIQLETCYCLRLLLTNASSNPLVPVLFSISINHPTLACRLRQVLPQVLSLRTVDGINKCQCLGMKNIASLVLAIYIAILGIQRSVATALQGSPSTRQRRHMNGILMQQPPVQQQQHCSST